MLKNPAPHPWNFSSPMTNFSTESSHRITPSPQPFPTKKSTLKVSAHYPITITMCKQWSKFATCSPSHGDSGGVSRPERLNF